MSEQVKRYEPQYFRGMISSMEESQNGTWMRACNHDAAVDALNKQIEGLRAENGRLREERDSFQRAGIRTMEQLEAARGLLAEIRPMVAKSPVSDWFARRDAILTTTPAPEGQPAVKYSLTAHGEQGERQQAVHWRAVLDPAEVPMQLNPHEHIAGFTDRRKAEDWIAARLCMDGWHYTLEPLYASPPPAQDVSGRPVVLATLYRDADGNPGCKFVGDPEIRIRDGDALMAVTQHDQEVRGLVEALEQIQRWDGFPPTGKTWEGSGEPVSFSVCYGSNGERDFMRNVANKALAAYRNPATVKRCPTCTGTCAEICAKARP